MKRKELVVGLDASKGTVEACCKRNDAQILFEDTYDDTPKGHKRLEDDIRKSVVSEKARSVVICMESTGGFERNWYRTFKMTTMIGEASVETVMLNPLLIKNFTSEKLHGSSTDISAARSIAEYLRLGRPLPKNGSSDLLLDGAVNLFRIIQNSIDRCSSIKNEFQSLLPQVHPDLGRFVRSSIPNWVLKLIILYPTVNDLKRIQVKTLAKIPGVTTERAEQLISGAKESVAAYRDDMTGLSIQHLAEEIMTLTLRIEALKERLTQEVGENDLVQRLCTIPGMGQWSAIGLITELGDISRFPKAEAVVAFSGLDPRYQQSGDGLITSKISRRGKASIRKLMFMPAQTAAQHNPVIKEFYDRLRGKGKSHRDAVTACMGKLLRIVFALWVTEKDFDPQYAQRKKPVEATSGEKQVPGKSDHKVDSWDEDAPISRQEAKRRKEAMKKRCSQQGSTARSTPHNPTAESEVKVGKKAAEQCKADRQPGPSKPSRDPLERTG